MFRQVILYRWIEGASEEAKDAFRESLAGLHVIPEVSSLRFADDGRYFDGNFDAVAVMDFPDFAAARRYVADERHQAYIRDHASKLLGERVVVQHDWAVHDLVGVHHVTLPVSDVNRSRNWYALAFGFEPSADTVPTADTEPTAETEPTDARPGAVTMVHPSSSMTVILRHDATRARALAGFDILSIAVGTVDDLDALIQQLDAKGITHGDPVPTPNGVHVGVVDPDGLVVRLTTLLS